MRVLHITNVSAGRCGVKNFGQMFTTAMRRAGCEVDEWDAEYSAIYARIQRGEPSYLPDNMDRYDVVHLNWHPITLNTYGTGHFDHIRGVKSIYLHDIPPHSGCPCLPAFSVRMTSEPSEISTLEVPYPICDWVDPKTLPPPNEEFTVGISGVRRDGFDAVVEVVERNGWILNASEPDAWISQEDEIRRLAKSSVNVCWYHEGRGLSGTPAMMLGSRRPLLINNSPMLRHLRGIEGVIYQPEHDLEYMLVQLQVTLDGWLTSQQGVDSALSWSTYAPKVLAAWEEAHG